MIITKHLGIALVRGSRAPMLVGRKDHMGRGWSCEACNYQSKTVFPDVIAASASHEYHRKTWCQMRGA